MNIGNIYAITAEYEKALEYYNQALTIRQSALGLEDSETILTQQKIAEVQANISESEK